MRIVRLFEETVGFGVEGLHASIDDVLERYVAEVRRGVLGGFGSCFG
jgi:hypothetical protein